MKCGKQLRFKSTEMCKGFELRFFLGGYGIFSESIKVASVIIRYLTPSGKEEKKTLYFQNIVQYWVHVFPNMRK